MRRRVCGTDHLSGSLVPLPLWGLRYFMFRPGGKSDMWCMILIFTGLFHERSLLFTSFPAHRPYSPMLFCHSAHGAGLTEVWEGLQLPECPASH